MKKFLFVTALLASLVFTLGACANKDTTTTSKDPSLSTMSIEITNATGKTENSATSDEGTVTSETAKEDVSLTKVETAGKLVMGLDDSFPPMGFRDDQQEIVGFDVDLAKEVAQRMGVELVLTPVVWENKEMELNTGAIDCIWNGLTMTPDRLKAMTFSTPYMQNQQIAVVRKDADIGKLTDLEGKIIAIQAGSSASDALIANPDLKASFGEVVELNDNVAAFMELETKIVDAVILDKVVAAYYIKQNGKDFIMLEESLADEEYGIGFRLGDISLKDKVDATLMEMAAEGKVSEIAAKWFGEDITTYKMN